MNKTSIIFVHIGAGNHSVDKEKIYKEAIKKACIVANEAIKLGKPCEKVVEIAIKSLENNPATNAGIGSNLTRNGTVQCDASIMRSSDGAFGAVGAVSAIKNPIEAAAKLLEFEAKGEDALGLVPPL
ncbi:putative threonine aspartase [Smittium culicis]|uniref:Putative threonine aspartase n=1 Tax=Smittium culicis TaxID=133412 RepID=A0A1R1X3H6_9FUNG|nr:putative threonine aspartase [Smittium culicis]